MASTFIDRLLGRTEVKAVTGPGAFALANFPPVHSMSRDPNRLMYEAQVLYHTNAWVNAAERAIVGRFTRMDWHLEDENGETVDETFAPPYQAVLQLLDRPSQNKSRRQLWGLTLRHNGLCGNAAWLLDQRDGLAGTPLETLYINPARLTPVHDAGGNVLGWILDAPGNPVTGQQGKPGIPLEREEVIHFTLDEPDWGIWGVGIAEAAQRKIELDKLTDYHAAGVFSSGGRLTGLVAPKVGTTVNDDQWLQFVRDYRRITEDPDAAKRLQVAKMPLDFTQMTASPKDLQLADVAKGNKEDILAMWAVPPSQIGIMQARGLNSGETVKYEEAALWQGAIEPRAEAFREKVQTGLLDRFADLGVKVTLVFDYPEFDDETPLYDNATKAKLVPLTHNERRAMVGLDPLEDEELGTQIYLASEMVRIDEVPEPEPEPVAPILPTNTPDEEEVVEDAVKADLRKPLLGLRAQTETTWEPRIRKAVQAVLNEQQRDISSRVAKYHGALARKPADSSVWWNEERETKRLTSALEPLVADLAAEVAQETARVVKKPAKADSVLERILEFVRKQVGQRITSINQTTREKVQAAVAEGIDKGIGPRELGALIQDSAAFDEYRAEMIGRSETMFAYNDSALRSYDDLDVAEVEAIDGDDDAACASRHGKRYPVSEAYGISDHPNGTLDWIPVVNP